VDDTSASLQWQCVQIGTLRLGVPYRWARQIVSDFEANLAPNSPAWLLGASNIDGRVIPVVDLAAYADAEVSANAMPMSQKPALLIGGEGETSAALVFRGLPAMRRAAPQAADAARAAVAQTAPRLAPFIVGYVEKTSDPRQDWYGLDAEKLFESLTLEAST
jgi:chemotaxis signal transduction protein